MSLSASSSTEVSDTPRTESAVRWLLASLFLWAVAGFCFGLITPLFSNFMDGLNSFSRPALLTILLAALVAAAQCLFLRAVRPWARRWVLVTVAGGAAYLVIIWALASLARPSPQPQNATWVRQLVDPPWGSLLLSGFIAILQKWSMHGRVIVPSWFLPACALASGVGVFGFFFFLSLLFSPALR